MCGNAGSHCCCYVVPLLLLLLLVQDIDDDDDNSNRNGDGPGQTMRKYIKAIKSVPCFDLHRHSI